MFSEKFSERIASKGRFSLETSTSFEINYTDKASNAFFQINFLQMKREDEKAIFLKLHAAPSAYARRFLELTADFPFLLTC